MAIPTIAYRLVLVKAARLQEIAAKDIIQELTIRIPVLGSERL
jgi:hypothetical protein